MMRTPAEQARDALERVAQDADQRDLVQMADDIANAARAMDDRALIMLRRLLK